jgi:3(or 17)beta-hydroxysteroid dehydrogenase
MPPRPSVSLAGHAALVSGAASGIGRATAQALAAEGARVLLADRNLAEAEEAAEAIRAAGGEARAQPLEVTSEEGWETAVGELLRRWGRLDVAVLAAGISHASPLVDTEFADWRRLFSVNLDGCFLGLRAAARAMRGVASAERQGRIVLVSSASGKKATPGAAAYAASKAAVSMLARSAALELAPEHVRVNAVLPGGVRTPLWEGMTFFQELVRSEGGLEGAWRALEAQAPGPGQRRLAAPEEIALGILYLVSDASTFVTGVELAMDGGYSA